MASIEDKMLGEKKDYYCSSSEDEDEVPPKEAPCNSKNTTGAHNTGPKGVLADWKRFKEMERIQDGIHKERLQHMTEKMSLTARTDKEDEIAKKLEKKEELLLEELEEDDFMREFMRKRMEEMKSVFRQNIKKHSYGQAVELTSADDFLAAIDEDSNHCTVVILIYEKNIPGCEAMVGCINCLAEDYPMVKFVKVKGSILGASKRFRNMGVPAVQAYRNQELIGNFVRLTEEFGEDFFADQVEQYFREYGILPDSNASEILLKPIKGIIVQSQIFDSSAKKEEDSDSDYDLD